MKYFISLLALFFCLIGFATLGTAATFLKGDTPTVAETVEDDVAISGNAVSITAPVNGEIFTAGGTVTLHSRPSRSIFAAGNDVTITKGAGYNVFVAGNIITLGGEIDHDVYAAGSTITLLEDTRIKGSVHLAASRIILNGTIEGDVLVAADTLESDATIGGSLTGEIGRTVFTGGKIAGDFRYTSKSDAEGLSTVTVGGATERKAPQAISTSRYLSLQSFLWTVLSTLVVGAVIILTLPKKLETVSDRVRQKYGYSLGLGLGVLVLVPVAAVILMVTFIGLPLALITLALYAIALYMAHVVGSFLFGKLVFGWLKQPNSNPWTNLLLGVVLVSLLRVYEPTRSFIDSILFLALTLPTLGALTLYWKERLNERA